MVESLQPSAFVQAVKPVTLIPVGLKEAALDSPTFRATTVHFSEQVEVIEKWLDGYIKSVTKLYHEVSHLENLVNGFLSHTTPPANVSEAVLDHDYSLQAMKRYGEGAREFWNFTIQGLRRMDSNFVEPIRAFQQNDLRSFKDARRQLEQTQKQFDNLQARYSAQGKTKEPSSLREDAFQLHEARKSYLRASMDFSIVAPSLRASLDKTLVKAFSDQWHDMLNSRESITSSFLKWGNEIDRIRSWSHEMEGGERAFRRELQSARKQFEEDTELAVRPSRELEDYSASSASVIAPKGSSTSNLFQSPGKTRPTQSEKQGWLNLRTITGKPARTVWVRRWFFVKNGIFGWLVQGSRSGAVEESERIGVLLCGVRPASQEERRFCFEVKTKDSTVLLQAETQPELLDWMKVFDVAKQKALEDPASTDSPGVGGSRAQDAAFAISPPSAPEFAASAADAGMQQSSDDASSFGFERTPTLPVPGDLSTSLAARTSFDVTANRRQTGLDRENEAGSGRDHAARIIQKLDLHRKPLPGSQAGGSSSAGSTTSGPPSGGIASLISASHNIMPAVPLPVPPTDAPTPRSGGFNNVRDLPISTLAPSTLANPPSPTNLSVVAVIVNGERGIGLGRTDNTGGMPSGIMANLWGSSNWGYINRLERGELRSSQEQIRKISNPPSPRTRAVDAQSRNGRIFSGQIPKSPPIGGQDVAPARSPDPSPRHRQTISLDSDTANLQRSSLAVQEFPNYYPLQLKAQDAQFRLLFPNVRREDKLVLVFRATWNPNDQQEFPGRVYVTSKDIYFYSHHLGLVLITGISLESIIEVTAAPGRDCDFLFLHLKDTEKGTNFTRITVKTFLEPLKLLQRRLNFLVQNCSSNIPVDLESIMKALIKLEHDDPTRSPSLESWEDLPVNVSSFPNRSASQRTSRDLRASVFVDQGLYGAAQRASESREFTKFKLPAQPVVYVPRGVNRLVVQKQFEISPKALFHVMFGDKSVVWQLLYHERRAQQIKQGPWTQQEQSHMRRAFEYQIGYQDLLYRTRQVAVTDTQMIDVLNDHLCYVVTDRKRPWHLPYHNSFMLVSKVVITHSAKSKCRLAIYTQVDWTRAPPFLFQTIVESRALADLELDALDLADVISDQVRKLGPQSRTKRAVQIFGQIGQQKEVSEFAANETPIAAQMRRLMRRRTITGIALEVTASLLEDIFTQIALWGLALLRWCWKTLNAHTFLLAILSASLLTNFFFSSRDTSTWWRERRANRFMNAMGIAGPDFVMSKAVYVNDLDAVAWGTNPNASDHDDSFPHSIFVTDDYNASTSTDNIRLPPIDDANPCLETFRSLTDLSSPLLSSPDPPSSIRPSSTSTTHRLHGTRRRLGSYRHDLLVAMRVVNSIEREVVRAEWEGWVQEEVERCGKMERLMEVEGKEEGSGSDTGDRKERAAEELRGELGAYCRSCRAVVG